MIRYLRYQNECLTYFKDWDNCRGHLPFAPYLPPIWMGLLEMLPFSKYNKFQEKIQKKRRVFSPKFDEKKETIFGEDLTL